MTKYELMFILDPTLEENVKNDTIDYVKDIVSANGEITNVDVWGKRRLAYPILNYNEGFYVVVDFDADSDAPYEIDRRMKITDRVIRHMLINREQK